jgi:hypothetical protein
MSVAGYRARGASHLLFILTPRLVDIHPVLVSHVLPSPSRAGATLIGVLLLPYALCDLLEYHVESLFVLDVFTRFGDVVFCEGYEFRVQRLQDRRCFDRPFDIKKVKRSGKDDRGGRCSKRTSAPNMSEFP